MPMDHFWSTGLPSSSSAFNDWDLGLGMEGAWQKSSVLDFDTQCAII